MPLYGDIIIALALVVVAIVATISTKRVRLVNRRFRLLDAIDDERVRRPTLRAHGPDAALIAERLKARGPRLQTQIASEASHARQEPRRFELRGIEDLREFAEDEQDLEFLQSLGVRSGVTVELRARGRPTGMLTISVGPSGRRYSEADVHFVSILAGRVALA